MSRVLSRLTKTATLRRMSTSGVDEYGNPALVEATEAVAGHVRILSTDETPENAGERWKLYLPPTETLAVEDRVTVDGDLFEVVSVPVGRHNPRTRLIEAFECEIERRS